MSDVASGAHAAGPVASSGRGGLLVAVLVAVFVVPLSVSGTAVALTEIAADLGANPVGQQWALNGFNVTFAASTLAWGSLADRIGRWRSFQIGALIFVAASAASLLAPTYAVLDAARIVAGLGAGAIFSVGSALLSIVFIGSERARVFSFMGAAAGLSLAFGPTLSGLVTQAASWRCLFAIQGVLLVASAALMVVGRRAVLGEPRARSPFDWPAAVLFFGAMVCLVSALVLGSSETGITSAVVILLFLGIACLLALAARERRTPHPLLDLRVVARPRFLGVSLVVAVASFTFASFVTYAPSLLQAAYGFTPAGSGFFVMFMTVPTLIAPLVAGSLVARGIAPRAVLTASLGLMVLGASAVSIAAGSSTVLLAVLMVLLGAGFGLHAGLVDNEGLAVLPDRDTGMAAGWINTMRVGTEAIAVSLFGAAFVPALAGSDPVAAFRVIGLISVAVSLIIAVVSVVAMNRGESAHAQEPTAD